MIITRTCVLLVENIDNCYNILDKTSIEYQNVCNTLSLMNKDTKISNRVKLHNIYHNKLREIYPNTKSVFLETIKDRVATAYKAKKSRLKTLYKLITSSTNKYKKYKLLKQLDKVKTSVPTFKSNTITLNVHGFTFNIKDRTVSIVTSSGRCTFKYKGCRYYLRYLFNSIKYTYIELVKRNNRWYIHVSCKLEVKDPIDLKDKNAIKSNLILGIDLGIRNIATTSIGNSSNIYQLSDSYKRKLSNIYKLRSKLQSNGSRSAKMHLKQTSRRIRNLQRNANRVLAKAIFDNNVYSKDTIAIAMENLTNILDTSIHRKKENKMFHTWNFFELKKCIKDKCNLYGLHFVEVDPRYTSKTCSRCGSIGMRSIDNFRCDQCGYTDHADINASINISVRGKEKLLG